MNLIQSFNKWKLTNSGWFSFLELDLFIYKAAWLYFLNNIYHIYRSDFCVKAVVLCKSCGFCCFILQLFGWDLNFWESEKKKCFHVISNAECKPSWPQTPQLILLHTNNNNTPRTEDLLRFHLHLYKNWAHQPWRTASVNRFIHRVAAETVLEDWLGIKHQLIHQYSSRISSHTNASHTALLSIVCTPQVKFTSLSKPNNPRIKYRFFSFSFTHTHF